MCSVYKSEGKVDCCSSSEPEGGSSEHGAAAAAAELKDLHDVAGAGLYDRLT